MNSALTVWSEAERPRLALGLLSGGTELLVAVCPVKIPGRQPALERNFTSSLGDSSQQELMAHLETSFDGLLTLGQQRGGLTTDDLVRALPIATMRTDEISAVITRLEDANVPVKVIRLLSPVRRATLGLALETGSDIPASSTAGAFLSPSFPSSSGVTSSPTSDALPRPGAYKGRAVIGAVAIAVALLIVLVWMLGAYHF